MIEAVKQLCSNAENDFSKHFKETRAALPVFRKLFDVIRREDGNYDKIEAEVMNADRTLMDVMGWQL